MPRLLKLVFVGVILSIGVIVIVDSNARNNPPQPASVQPHNGARRLVAKSLESNLLSMGFDVQVSVIEEDDSQLIIYGKSVNRPFAHNLMARRDFKKLLHDSKFSEVTFMDSMKFPDFVQAYDVR
ncbi:MAG TPA: hypothetical protein VK812_13265 [Candidatus Binatus sp.]|jgi:hypothetical protein|nr:hypothetical protein [Candidatus Binatus sp.]